MQVFVHVSFSDADGKEQFWSSRVEQGGTGEPLAFTLGKGARAPRGLEIALAGTRVQELECCGTLHCLCQHARVRVCHVHYPASGFAAKA